MAFTIRYTIRDILSARRVNKERSFIEKLAANTELYTRIIN